MLTKAPLIAAIDVGTNSFHLLIASVNNRGMLQINSREKEVVRLGSSSGDMKYLSPEAISRGFETLKNFAQLAKSENAEIFAVATSAVREALNKKEFLDKVKDELGIDIEVISGNEEGRLIYLGVLHALPILNKKTLIIDIGGGSTETIVGLNGEILYVNSVKLGAIRLTKRFFDTDKISNKQIEECREFIKGEWTPILKNVEKCGFETVVGTSGTIQNIALMVLSEKNERIPDILNGITISTEDSLKIIQRIISAKTNEERLELPGIDPSRVDIIVAGALIFEFILKTLQIKKFCISSYALREGILFDKVEKANALQQYGNLSHLRYETIYFLCQQYKVDLKHAEYVKNIALTIFDSLQELHKLGNYERELLEAASLLHDAGYYIAHDQHHKHSYYLIMNSIMPGFTNDEAEIIANIARYHRKSHPKKKHIEFQNLSEEKQRIVKILAGILRIAEGIDRRQLQTVKEVKVYSNAKEINIHLIPNENSEYPDIELWGANRRKLLLEETFKKIVNFYIPTSNN